MVLAALFLLGGWGLALREAGSWPLLTSPELIVASAVAAVCWYLVDGNAHRARWGPLTFVMVTVGMVAWAMVRWPVGAVSSVATSVAAAWTCTTNLLLALACGAYAEAGSQAVAQLVAKHGADEPPAEGVGAYALMAGLPLLTASLVIHLMAGLYSNGLIWSWSASEAWRLLLWLLYTIIWCSVVLLSWRGRRVWIWLAGALLLNALVWIVGV